MLFPDNFDDFLQHGYFLCAPYFGKVWCLIGDESSKEFQYQNKHAFYRNNFYCSLKKPWITGHLYELGISQFFTLIFKYGDSPPILQWNSKKSSKYEEFFKCIQDAIKQNYIAKAVPFFQEMAHTKLNVSNLIYFLKQMSKLKKNKTIFMYGFWNFKKNYLQLGVTPELLFFKKQNVVNTIALAGTSTNPDFDFKKQKMQDEHGFVLKDLLTELACYGTVKRSKIYTVQYNCYFHKKTKIAVTCHKFEPKFTQLLKSLYPSAAIGAYPRQKGLDLLSEIEKKLQIHRGFFASPFGLQIHDFMLCISTIRGIEWMQDKLFVTAGGGIIAQSQLPLEWKEILLKLESIKSILGLI